MASAIFLLVPVGLKYIVITRFILFSFPSLNFTGVLKEERDLILQSASPAAADLLSQLLVPTGF